MVASELRNLIDGILAAFSGGQISIHIAVGNIHTDDAIAICL
jgi:hypothetical protein